MNQPTFTVQIRDFCDLNTGAIDLSKLFHLSEKGRNQIALRPSMSVMRQAERSGRLQAPVLPSSRGPGMALALPISRPWANGFALRQVAPMFAPASAVPDKPKSLLNFPNPRTYSIQKTQGSISQWPASADLEDLGKATVTLPFFVGRHITAAALKSLAGHPEDVILQKKGKRWEIVSDDHMIDLDDRTQVYRVGPVQVYS